MGWGGNDYTAGTLELSGSVPAGDTFKVAGPLSDAGNGNSTYDLRVDFGLNLWNGGFIAGGDALFNVTVASITSANSAH